ncbi:hypothetical protein LCGC14_2114720 [marine sediment metagenome]|uniref:N-acetyltransferase domain-containing protein n=1 Tax=marine sediment metagenome TaxID=412755 RepID=A0A0F9ET60_9ZZZZ
MLELTLIDPQAMSGDEVEDLWKKVKSQPYAFDDSTKDRPDAFVMQLFRSDTLTLKLGNYGMVSLREMVPYGNANIHFIFWDRAPIKESLELIKLLLYGLLNNDPYHLRRLTACIPAEIAKPTEHAAQVLGFKLEGRMRKAAIYNSKYYDFLIYGLLREDFVLEGGSNGRRT